jgi:hypothetical protein
MEVELPTFYDPTLTDELWPQLDQSADEPIHPHSGIESQDVHMYSEASWIDNFLNDPQLLDMQMLDIEDAGTTKEERGPDKPAGKRLKINPEQKKVLEDALNCNPYPDETHRTILGEATGMTEKQVRRWFNNTRARRPCRSRL